MDKSQAYVEFVRECRDHCLWFLRPDAVPADRQTQIHSLDCIERYGRRDEFVRARELKAWLSQRSSRAFVVS